MFHFLLIFKLFPIGYGPTPSKRKDIVLEQEVVKGSLHSIEKENPFEERLQGCKESDSPFPSGGIQGDCKTFQVSAKCGRDFFKML
jgi:hypothetical protein